jgi:hypothetical protein
VCREVVIVGLWADMDTEAADKARKGYKAFPKPCYLSYERLSMPLRRRHDRCPGGVRKL